MDQAFLGLVGINCFVHIDDIVIFCATINEHNKNLKIILQQIHKLGLKLGPAKCEFLKPELEYLGHLITADGIKPNPVKIEALKNL